MTDFYADVIANNGAEFHSEAIDAIAYNRDDKIMLVEFASGGDYVYGDVEESTFNLFVGAPSVGRFYRNHISGKYTNLGIKVDDVIQNEDPKTDDNVVPLFPNTETPTGVVIGELDGEQLFVAPNEYNIIAPSLYTVRWEALDGRIGGSPEFQALGEADALAQFNAALTATGITEARIVSVTHYF